MISEVNIYMVDIVWILLYYYVMFMCRGQNSGFCKTSLKICDVSFFECKSPWMLKTVMNCQPRVEQKITKLDWKSTMDSVVRLSSYFCV